LNHIIFALNYHLAQIILTRLFSFYAWTC